MKLDLQAKTLAVSVREIVAPRERRPSPGAAKWRTRLGQRAHLAYGRQVSDTCSHDEEVETEVPLSTRREVLGFACTVKGRADVIRRRLDRVTVEEVKSVLSRPGEDALARAMFQARLYAFFLDAEEVDADAAVEPNPGARGALRHETRTGWLPIGAEVVLYSLVDGRIEVLDAGYAHDDVAAELDEALGVLLQEALDGVAFRARRAATADELVFPFGSPRAHQLELMDILQDALARGRPALAAAPTGIGKTVSSLLPALRHALRNDATVFYLTAKTTQRKLVGETFEGIVRASGQTAHPLRALTLRSRAEMCPPGDLRCHPRVCPLLADFEQRAAEGRVVETLLERPHLDPRDIFERGRVTKLCPYELSMRAAAQVDVIIGDYNHLFDERAAPVGLGAITARVVVLDEAHNLFDRARGYFSPFVGQRAVRAAQEATRQVEPPALANELWRWCEAVLEVLIDGARWRGEGERPAMDGNAPAVLDVEQWQALTEEGELLGARHAQERFLRASVRGEDPVLTLVAEVSLLADLAASGDDELVAYASSADGEHGVGVGIVCVDPARRLERIHQKAIGTLAVSATMAPLTYFSEVLGFARLDPVLTSAPSPFPTEQRQVLISADVSTTYRERDAFAPLIAQRIEQTYRARAGRYIAFFSSFAYAGKVRQHLTLPPREILMQLPASGGAARALILKQLQQSSQSLLLAVMGGVFGEGIDLPGDELIGVVVVGPGLPPVSFERMAMQHYFAERHDRGFAYAMVYPGLQRVIQAAGRVIRTMEDAGVIVLLGKRFAEPDYIDCLPEHWYRHRPEELITNDLVGDLARFWDGQD